MNWSLLERNSRQFKQNLHFLFKFGIKSLEVWSNPKYKQRYRKVWSKEEILQIVIDQQWLIWISDPTRVILNIKWLNLRNMKAKASIWKILCDGR